MYDISFFQPLRTRFFLILETRKTDPFILELRMKKWTLNERLTNGERKVNTFLSAKWAHDERFVNGKRERSGTESA